MKFRLLLFLLLVTACASVFGDSAGSAASDVQALSASRTAVQEDKLSPSVTGFAESGWSVSLDGERALVGATRLSTQGVVDVFDRNPGTGLWPRSDVLLPSDPGTGRFANSVSVDGDRALVGAPFNAANGSASGAAYVFERDSLTGIWSQSVRLFSDDIGQGDIFGRSVSLSGDRALIGADGADGSGAAYIFDRNPVTGVWSQSAKLVADDAAAGDNFGWSVSLSGDRALVGASDSFSIGNTGAAYVFDRDTVSGLWPQSAKLVATDAGSADRFGWSVSLSGDRALVGAYLDDDAGDRSGSAYVFDRDAGSGLWSQTDKLTANDAAANDEFGYAVSLSGDRALVGAPNNDSRRGAAYLFGRDPATDLWPQNAKLVVADAEIGDNLGWSLSVSGARVLVGAVGDNSNAGSAYILALPTFSIGGTISGLSGGGLVLQNNSGDDLPLTANGAFTFPGLFADGQTYDVTVLSQPTGPSQTCSVSNGSGTVSGADVTDVQVTCVNDSFTIGGTVLGLAGTGLVLQNNGGGDLPIGADGAFTFSTAVNDGSGFAVTVLTQPSAPSQTCSVSNGVGTVNGADVTDIQITCTINTFTIGGNVSGLSGSGLVLQNNGGDDWPITADGSFTFATLLNDGSNYSVTVATQPTGPNQTCSVVDGSGTVSGANVTDVQITCITDQFTVGGIVSGLVGDGLVLQNNAGNDLLIAANGPFTFPAQNDGTTYTVTVADQPTAPSQTCSVINGAGTVSGADITDVQITCVTDTFSIGGTVTGLDGTGLVLQNNGGDDLAITGNGPFTFATELEDGSAYTVTVLTQPTGPNQTCTVTNGSGTLSGADVTDVQVTCVTDQFTIGGTVNGLNGTGLVLQNNGGDDLSITTDGPFAFATPLDDGSDYAVTVLNQPVTARDQQCTVINGSGTLMGADETDVAVQCQDILIGVSVTNLDLGLVLIGAQGSATITLTNSGQPDLVITEISSPSAPFSLIGGDCLSLPLTLSAGQSCQIEIAFSPTTAGTFNDSLQITSNATSSPDTVRVSGTASFEPLIVPTLNAWPLFILALLLGMIGVIASRKLSRE